MPACAMTFESTMVPKLQDFFFKVHLRLREGPERVPVPSPIPFRLQKSVIPHFRYSHDPVIPCFIVVNEPKGSLFKTPL